MILPLMICPIIYLIMTKMAKYYQHYETNPRLLTYGKSFLLDVPFTIVLINIPNICVSFVVSIQTFGVSNILSFVTSIVLGILIITAGLIFIIFRS